MAPNDLVDFSICKPVLVFFVDSSQNSVLKFSDHVRSIAISLEDEARNAVAGQQVLNSKREIARNALSNLLRSDIKRAIEPFLDNHDEFDAGALSSVSDEIFVGYWGRALSIIKSGTNAEAAYEVLGKMAAGYCLRDFIEKYCSEDEG